MARYGGRVSGTSKWIRVDGIPALQHRIKEVKAVPIDLLRAIQLETVARAKIKVPVESGRTRDSIHPGALSGSAAEIKASGAARYLERGTKGPYRIPKRKGKNLRFQPEGESKFIFRKSVQHPGIEAQPFLQPAAEEAVEHVINDGGPIIEAWNRGA